jgi:hypothetical protein
MNKVQFILLLSIVGFYALLSAYLLLRVCAGCFRFLREALAPKFESVSRELAVRRGRAWTREGWHEAVVLDLQRAARTAAAPASSQHKALC